jgi:hypothetical protein
MASPDIRRFLAYLQYIVQPQDMDDIQRWERDSLEGLAEGSLGGSILAGLDVQVAGGLTLQVDPGIGSSPEGRMVVVTASTQVTAAADPSFDRRSLLVLRPKETPTQFIPSPTGGPNVPLHNKFEFDLLVIAGTPSATPTYPAPGADDVVLMGLLIPAGAGSISVTDFEVTPRMAPKRPRRKIREISESYVAASGEGAEDIIEFDASAGDGTIDLPPAITMLGRELTIMKVDSSSNAFEVFPAGAETISGQASILMDTQWQNVKLYAHKQAWRLL